MEAFRLRVEPRDGEPFTHLCEGTSVVFGRASRCDVVLTDRYSSRRHARVFRQEGAWFVEDLGSRNTTLLNGRPVTAPERLGPGDVLRMCDTQVIVEAPTPPPAPPPVPRARATEGREDAPFVSAAALIDEDTEPATVVGEAGLRRYAKRLKVLNDVHQTLARPISLEGLLGVIIDSAFDLLRPEQGAVFLKRPDGALVCVAERRLPGTPAATFSSQSLAAEVIDKGLAALVLDASTDERFAEAPSFLDAGIRSLVAAPLLHSENCPGMIVLTSQIHRRRFSQEDRELLVSLASVAGLRIRNIGLVEEAGRRLLMEQELDLARQIQLALLPEQLPAVPGHLLLAESQPSRRVSGDLYLVRERAGDEVVILVADVSGKGIAASLLTASLEALATGPIELGLPADEICLNLSRHLYARTPPERFATAFLAVLAPATGRLRYANAGHNPPIHLKASGQIDRLAATGPPLGILPGASYSLGEASLDPGDTLVVYTDGITEATNAAEEEYGLGRLEEVCRQSGDAPPHAMGAALAADLQSFVGGAPFADDRTLVIVQRRAEEAAPAP